MDVLVAKADIAIGDSVTPDLVEVKEVDPEAVSGTRIADPSQLTGSPALFPIKAGSQVSKEAVGLGTIANICITCQLEPGEKAIAFQVERVTGLDFLIQRGRPHRHHLPRRRSRFSSPPSIPTRPTRASSRSPGSRARRP